MACEILRGIQILREQRRRHHQCRTRVGESLASRAINGKLLRRIERRDACEVTNRVSVFHVRQTPKHHRAGITSAGERDVIQRALHPVREQLHLLGRRSRFPFRRHFVVANLFQRTLPHHRVALHEFESREALHTEITLLLLGRVAGDAVFLQHRLNGLAKHLFIRSSCDEDQRRDDAQIKRGLHAIISRRTSPYTSVRR